MTCSTRPTMVCNCCCRAFSFGPPTSGHFLDDPLGLIDHVPRGGHQCSVAVVPTLFGPLIFLPGAKRNRQRLFPNRPHAVTQIGFQSAHGFSDPLHGAREYACAIGEQTAIGWVMNVAFYYRPPAADGLGSVCARALSSPPGMQLLDHFWS